MTERPFRVFGFFSWNVSPEFTFVNTFLACKYSYTAMLLYSMFHCRIGSMHPVCYMRNSDCLNQLSASVLQFSLGLAVKVIINMLTRFKTCMTPRCMQCPQGLKGISRHLSPISYLSPTHSSSCKASGATMLQQMVINGSKSSPCTYTTFSLADT